MPDPVRIVLARPSDAAVLARHRVAMFRDMRRVERASEADLEAATCAYLRTALARGTYVGWLGLHGDGRSDVVAGAGLVLRPLLPRPGRDGRTIQQGSEGLVVNVWVEPLWRRQGLARRLMQEVLAWSRARGLARLVLHASEDGRRLYEGLGFLPTGEMELGSAENGEARIL